MEIEAVKCDGCKKIFEVNSREYFSVHGNILIGKEGGLIGNNFDEEGKLCNVNHFCINCLKNILIDDTQTNKKD